MKKFNVLIPDGDDRRTIKVVQSLGASGKTNSFVITKNKNIVKYSRFCKPFFISQNGGYADINACMEKALRKHSIDVILTVGEKGANYIETNDWVRKLKLAPVSNISTLNKVSNKWTLSKICEGLSLNYPKSIHISRKEDIGKISEIHGYPVLIKPVTGAGGEGIVLVHTEEMLHDYIGDRLIYNGIEEYLVQEYISGPDIDISVLCQQGKILAFTIQEPIDKSEKVFKFSKSIRFLVDKNILEYCQKLVSNVCWNGVAHLDFKREKNSDEIYLIDFNGRFWGTLLGSTCAGVNFPFLACLSGLGINFSIPKYKNINYFEMENAREIVSFMLRKNQRKNVAVRNSRVYFALIDPQPFIMKKPQLLGRVFKSWY